MVTAVCGGIWGRCGERWRCGRKDAGQSGVVCGGAGKMHGFGGDDGGSLDCWDAGCAEVRNRIMTLIITPSVLRSGRERRRRQTGLGGRGCRGPSLIPVIRLVISAYPRRSPPQLSRTITTPSYDPQLEKNHDSCAYSQTPSLHIDPNPTLMLEQDQNMPKPRCCSYISLRVFDDISPAKPPPTAPHPPPSASTPPSPPRPSPSSPPSSIPTLQTSPAPPHTTSDN